jgi:hypothetical protein
LKEETVTLVERWLLIAGLLSIGASIISLMAALFKLIISYSFIQAAVYTSWSAVLQTYFAPMFLFVVAAFTYVLGFSMVHTSGRTSRRVIHPDDYYLLGTMLLNNNRAGIDDWIRLSSLTGSIGAFTKVGLYGLPLATIVLTITFAILGVVTLTYAETSKAMFDMSKLTLGAFIGSYVQRQTFQPTTPGVGKPTTEGAGKPDQNPSP